MKFNPLRFAIATSITWGLCILMVGWMAAAGWGNDGLVNVISALYLGFKATFIGGIIGLMWGLIDGLAGGYVFALILNKVNSKA